MIKLSDVKVRPQYRTRVRYRLVALEYAWEHGPAAAGRHCGLSARTIRRWRKRWRRGGVEGLVPSYPRHRARRVSPAAVDQSAVLSEREDRDEEAPVHRPADRPGPAPGRAGPAGGRALPQARRQRDDVLPWKKRYAGMGVAELRRVKQLEDENRRLKQVVADLTLDKQMLQDVLQKKV